MIDRSWRARLAVVTGALLLALAAGPSVTAATLTPIKVGIPGLSIGYAPYFMAQSLGLFAKNGLDATFVTLSDDTLPAALTSNGIQVTPLSGSITSGSLAGFKVKSVGLLVSKLPWMLIAKSSIASVADLKGKRIISSPPKAAPNLLLRYLLTKGGVAPDAVQLLHIGSVAARQTLMENGGGDAILDDIKSGYELEDQLPGVHTLVPSTAMPDQVGTGVGVSEEMIAQHPDEVRAMLRALVAADDYIKAHPREAAPILAKDLKIPDAVALRATQGLIADFAPQLVPSPTIYENEATMRTLGGDKVTAAQIASTWNTTLAAEVDRELKR